jgi:alkanesulfonate monooxygenase SsuD/methylene tetrahydromethanopterin reductase-like flavin-dependent oxidoreductase (luciferase family)/FAD/FMN-containing dehydrogenase
VTDDYPEEEIPVDYGHTLQFGTFISPTAASPEAPVALAQLSERLGFDLVTFQDHPYNSGFLDTWTLMSWIAAATNSVHIAGNVLNLPLRQPAVLARAHASLDLLSGGRIEMGLGAGGFWDAIAGMGQTKLTAGQSVTALEEAIGIIRGIWDADERRPLRLEGTVHSVNGAKRGPRPAHDIPIWIGAYKPRMLRLTGRLGDGWLPSLPYLQPGDLAAGNATIDDAAREAGRDPREIRRLLNIGQLAGSTAAQVEQLVAYALDEGIGTFILMGDDPGAMQAFAEGVAPAVREQVARERAASGIAPGPFRSPAAIRLRRSGIDYDSVPATVPAVEPGDFAYGTVKSTYMRGGSPGLVLRPRTVDEVVDALAFARSQDVPLAVRSGGHGISGRSTNDGGIVIDVAALNGIEVLDEERRLVRIGPGARWMDVAAALGEHGWALSSGDYGGVGVGGLATAGGIGWLARSHGLTIDHVRAVEIVLADGSVVRVDADHDPELFWAARGAGANMGIVTAFDFEVDQVGEIGFAQLAFDATDTAGFLERWGSAVESAPRTLTSFVILGGRRPGQPRIATVLAAVDSDDPETIIATLQPLAEAAPLVDQSVQLLPYSAVMANASSEPHQGQGEPLSRSGLIEHVTPEFARDAAALLERGESYFFQLRSVGGAVSDVAEDATAYAHRSAAFSVVAFGTRGSGLDATWEAMDAHFSGLYLSFETSLNPERIDRAFPASTLARVRAVKERVDPDNVFRDNFNVVPVEAITG